MNKTIGSKKEIKIGLLGYGFMGKAHTHAYRTIQHKYKDSGFIPKLCAISGLGETETENAAIQYSFDKWTTDWKEVVNDPEVDCIDICLTEDMHESACLEAIRAEKHVFCEKPLALNSQSCRNILEAVHGKDIKTMCGFNYRFLPAIRFAKEMIDSGLIGKIYCIRANYALEGGHDPNRPADEIRYINGKEPLGTIRGIGSHLIDVTRYLCGEICSVSANVKTMVPVRPLTTGGGFNVSVDDIAVMGVELQNGGIGSLTATSLAPGRKNHLAFEINGSLGTICFDLENLNILSVYTAEGPKQYRGFSHINVTDASHPLLKDAWPPAHIQGWETGHVNELYYFLESVFNDSCISPTGATFEDGYIAAMIAEAAEESSKLERKIILRGI